MIYFHIKSLEEHNDIKRLSCKSDSTKIQITLTLTYSYMKTSVFNKKNDTKI